MNKPYIDDLDMLDVLEPAEVGTVSDSQEDNQFLNELDSGYIGLSKPEVVKETISREDSWVLHQRLEASRKLGVPLSEINEEPDNDPSSASEAWA